MSRPILTLTVPVRLAALADLEGVIGRQCAVHDVPPACVEMLQLIVEELFVNVVEHAPAGPTDGTFTLTLECDGDAVALRTVDDGPAFDPTIRAEDAPESLSAARIGGAGLRLIRALGQDFAYERRDGRNRIALRVPLS